MIDVSCNNALIHVKRDGYAKNKKDFMHSLSLQLAATFAKKRHASNRQLTKSITQAAELFNFCQILLNTARSSTLVAAKCAVKYLGHAVIAASDLYVVGIKC